MTIPHPFQIIAHAGNAASLVILMILTATIMFISALIAEPLKTDTAPKGIISLELARDAEEVNQILNSWAENRKYAIFSVGFDYLFIVFYSITIALACVYASSVFVKQSSLWANIGIALAWGAFLAGLLDVVENFALYKMLFGSSKEIWPKISRPCAQIKFLFALFLGPGYAIIGFVFWLIRIIIKNPG